MRPGVEATVFATEATVSAVFLALSWTFPGNSTTVRATSETVCVVSAYASRTCPGTACTRRCVSWTVRATLWTAALASSGLRFSDATFRFASSTVERASRGSRCSVRRVASAFDTVASHVLRTRRGTDAIALAVFSTALAPWRNRRFASDAPASSSPGARSSCALTSSTVAVAFSTDCLVSSGSFLSLSIAASAVSSPSLNDDDDVSASFFGCVGASTRSPTR
mmetsp:Transcript_11690/g.35049  ORF Transcript_11690/g.35049 Transcript_11690/m.35049 type:complete len:223 (+) Transcript_11690:873-1541(+)